MLIAALGSSFAAGPTLEPVAERAAMRSAVNYPHRLARALGADLVDLSVSGATTATILDDAQTIAPTVQFPPQIDGLPADADLVTITAKYDADKARWRELKAIQDANAAAAAAENRPGASARK